MIRNRAEIRFQTGNKKFQAGQFGQIFRQLLLGNRFCQSIGKKLYSPYLFRQVLQYFFGNNFTAERIFFFQQIRLCPSFVSLHNPGDKSIKKATGCSSKSHPVARHVSIVQPALFTGASTTAACRLLGWRFLSWCFLCCLGATCTALFFTASCGGGTSTNRQAGTTNQAGNTQACQ